MTSPYTITASPSADGERVTVVVERNDHEDKFCHRYHLAADEAGEWRDVLADAVDNAKRRRKAIRKAQRAAEAVAPAATSAGGG